MRGRISGPKTRALLVRLRGLFGAARREPEMREEFQHDLALMIEDGERRGLPRAEARRLALVQLGGMEQVMQQVRERRGLPPVEELVQDLRFALRQFGRRPGFVFSAVLTLALGFAASVAIFAFVDAAMIRPLPFPDPGKLMFVTETAEMFGPANLSWQDYEDWRRMAKSFDSLAAWRYSGGPMRIGDQLVPEPGIAVSGNFLETLGVHPQIGRDFSAADSVPGAARVAMLTDDLWREGFHGDAGVVNRMIEIGGDAYQVVGVLPKGFEFAPRGRIQFVSALSMREGFCEARRSCHSLLGVGRLRDGVTVKQADDEVKNIARVLEGQYPDSNRGQGAVAMPLTEQIVKGIRPVLYTLLSAALLLCLIACINVASLLLVRSESRRREFALRAALGATWLRMLRQFAVESVVLVVAGGAVGLGMAWGGVRLMMLLVPKPMRDSMPFFDAVSLNRDVLLFALGVAVVALVLFTLVPAVRLSWQKLQRAITEGSASAGAGSLSWRRLGSLMVIAEVAVSIVLLVGAGLLGRSLTNLLHTELNFDAKNLVTLSLGFPLKKFPEDAQRVAMERQVRDRLAAIPGVSSVGYVDLLPVSYNGNTDWIRFPGRPYDGKHIEINARAVSSGYFSTLGVKLERGRFIEDGDVDGKPLAAVVNRRFAELYFPGQDPVGKTFGDTSLDPKRMKTIVGVVANLHEGTLDDEIWPAAYYSEYQAEGGMWPVLRVSGGEASVMAALPAVVRSVDPDLSVADVSTMSDRIESSQSAILHRGAAWLAGTFAVAALLLSAVGLYGVVSYSVSLRTREIGVRMALGAGRGSIYKGVLGEAGRLGVTGMVVGVVLSVATTSLLKAVLFGVSGWDWPTLAGACVVLLLCSFGAAVVPARRAALTDPTEALRAE